MEYEKTIAYVVYRDRDVSAVLFMFLSDFLECDESGDNDDTNEGRRQHFFFLLLLPPLCAAAHSSHRIFIAF